MFFIFSSLDMIFVPQLLFSIIIEKYFGSDPTSPFILACFLFYILGVAIGSSLAPHLPKILFSSLTLTLLSY